jgi:DNA processing protein
VAEPADRDHDELAAYLALAAIPGIGAVRIGALLGAFETARSTLAAPHGALAAVPGIGRAAASAIRAASPAAGARVLAALDALGARVLLPADADFPPLLREIPEPPVALFAWGDVSLLRRPAAAMVGSRDHTGYGADAARILAGGAARAGAVVVSGMARGIDALAHAAALDAGGASVGVLGNGFGVVYPSANRALYDRMVALGCLVTELPPGERPRVHTFPRRNRLISGLALATVVVEARPESGAMITADAALDQGRAVLAVPGPITSRTSLGCNRLIQQGAKACLAAEDILEEIGLPGFGTRDEGRGTGRLPEQSRPASPVPAPPADLSALQRSLWDTLARDARHIDDLAGAAAADPAEVLVALTDLELRGLVRQGAGMRFALNAETGTRNAELQ